MIEADGLSRHIEWMLSQEDGGNNFPQEERREVNQNEFTNECAKNEGSGPIQSSLGVSRIQARLCI